MNIIKGAFQLPFFLQEIRGKTFSSWNFEKSIPTINCKTKKTECQYDIRFFHGSKIATLCLINSGFIGQTPFTLFLDESAHRQCLSICGYKFQNVHRRRKMAH